MYVQFTAGEASTNPARCSFRQGECVREDVLHVPAQGAAGAAGQHHEGGQPAPWSPAQPALRQTGAEMVRRFLEKWALYGSLGIRFTAGVLLRCLRKGCLLTSALLGTCRALWSCWIMRTESQRMLTFWTSEWTLPQWMIHDSKVWYMYGAVSTALSGTQLFCAGFMSLCLESLCS